VEDGALVGRTVLGEKNSFLSPPKEYADFVLEFEVWVDPKVNSGVQIRSESKPGYRDGVVHGYQIEIDPSERAWSGGIYDEQRRGWLANPKDDPAAQKAFKVGEWNRYRVEASGDRLRTWVNDVPVSDITDGMTRSGCKRPACPGCRPAGGGERRPGAPLLDWSVCGDARWRRAARRLGSDGAGRVRYGPDGSGAAGSGRRQRCGRSSSSRS
jgi:hypothetical protein